MTDVDKKGLDDFVISGRTGRRNAMADILDERSRATGAAVAGLPQQLKQLSCTDDGDDTKSGTACAPATRVSNDQSPPSPLPGETATSNSNSNTSKTTATTNSSNGS